MHITGKTSSFLRIALELLKERAIYTNSITRIIISLLQQVRSLPSFSPSLLAAISHFIGGWTPGYARYSKIRPDFYVREPYPPSRRAKNSSLAFAKKLPPEKLLLPGQEDLPPLPPGIPELEELDDKAEGSSSGGVLNGPNQRRDNSLTMSVVYNEREVMDPIEKCEALARTRFS